MNKRGGGDAGKGDVEKLRGRKVGSQGVMWREKEREGGREGMRDGVNNEWGQCNGFFFFFCKSSFQWSSINADSLTGKAGGGNVSRSEERGGARAGTPL